MRLLIILLFVPLLTQAQNDKRRSVRLHLLKKADITKERPIRFHFYGTYGMPIGGFNANSNNIFITGQAEEGSGGALLFTFPVYKKWHIGLRASILDYRFDIGKVQTQLRERYVASGYITEETPTLTQYSMPVAYLGLVVSKVYKLWFLGVEPSVVVGSAFAGIKGYGKLRQHNITANDVEFVNLEHKFDNNIMIAGSAGVRLNIPFFKWNRCNFSTGLFYTTTSNLKTNFTATRADFYGNENTVEQFTVNNNISAFHLDIGLQLKLWHRLNDDEKK